MAYFLSSYLQKRLLRYALSRLDFIETDSLDLDDLGVRLGQRSVVELKNVAIKVKTIAEKLQLPSYIQLGNATIRLLRLTIPADLHASGIEVEIDGIDVTTKLINQEQGTQEKIPHSRPTSIPSRKDRANRPRVHSPPIHDPGGSNLPTNNDNHVELSRVIPSSRDMAISFLESEPLDERRELEAAIESQSHYMQDSISSSEFEEESGLGLQGGLTLPSFVASFFKGVADRLSIKVSNVVLTVEMDLSTAVDVEKDTLTFELRVKSFEVGASSTTTDSNLETKSSRTIRLEGLEFGLMVDPDNVSFPNSPRMTRSQSKMSSTTKQTQEEDDDATREMQATQLLHSTQSLHTSQRLPQSPGSPDQLSSDEMSDSTFQLDHSLGLGIDRSTPSVAFPASEIEAAQSSNYHEIEQPKASSSIIDNMAYAKEMAKSERISSRERQSSSSEVDIGGLYESKLFTHDEAESMYMSALSNDNEDTSTKAGMPGAWEWSDAVQEQPVENSAESETLPSSVVIRPVQSNESQSTASIMDETPSPAPSIPFHTPEPAHNTIEEEPSDSSASFVRLLLLTFLSVRIPESFMDHQTPTKLDEEKQRLPELNTSSYDSRHVRKGSDLKSSHSQAPALYTSRMGTPNQYDQTNVTSGLTQSAEPVSLGVSALKLAVDMQTCKILVRVAQSLVARLPNTTKSTQTSPSPTTSQPDLHVHLNEIQLQFCEALSRPSGSLSPISSDDPVSPEDPLLLLTLRSITYVTAKARLESQRLTIAKVSLHHGSKEVLEFIDRVNVRDSISSSSILRPHDVVVSNIDGRIEGQIKPVHIVLNLVVIDDVLSRSGGLSSLLDLGNSIAATSAGKGTTEMQTPAVPSRTVRFNAPQQQIRTERDPNSGPKINIRISGSVIDLVGSDASMQIKSLAIKVVYRQDNTRIVIDEAVVAGPLLSKSRMPSPISVKLRNLEIYFSNSPLEADLDRLLSLITPSSDQYDKDDDIMVDTLLRQRRKGAVLRVHLGELQLGIRGIAWQSHLSKLSDELAKLSSVTKYLPEDDRPGILVFALANKLNIHAEIDPAFGPIDLNAELLEAAIISFPSLYAAQISSWNIEHDKDILIGEVLSQKNAVMGPPMLMTRFIADEMDPTVRIKLTNTCFEYKVPTLVAITDLVDRLKPNLVDKPDILSQQSSPTSSSSDTSGLSRKTRYLIVFRDSAIALNPTGSPAKGLFLLSEASVCHSSHKRNQKVTLDLKKASILVVNNNDQNTDESSNADQKLYFDQSDQIQELTKSGFVPVGSISAAITTVDIIQKDNEQQLDIEFKNSLLFLETCADSTQTLFQILGGLAPPTPPSQAVKYRTEIIPIQDMLASFTGNAFVSEPGPELGLDASQISNSTTSEADEDERDYVNDVYHDNEHDEMAASYVESDISDSTISASLHVAPVEVTAPVDYNMAQSMVAHSMLDFRTDHFAANSSVGGTAHRWDSTKNTYGLASDTIFQKTPLKIKVRDVHIIWNLFDGYDWEATRDTISQAVKDIEAKAMNRRPRSASRVSPGAEDDEESVIGDFLFNSIYIGISANKDPRDLTSAINHDIDDLVSETGSYATSTTVTASPNRRYSSTRSRPKKLRLNRSKQHKITFELEGVSADVVTFPPDSGEVESSIDVRVRKLEVFDHVPTSTWKKFATYMQDAGEREVDTPMVHLEILNVKPVAELAASEIVLKVTVLPLRLHVDQDALDFMTRFFEFKDDRVPVPTAPSNPPFIQRVEVNPIRIRLDFKPKRVDYGGLRSGRTTEFMNFFILDRADMVLRRVIIYGVSGFDRLGIMLNNIWSPDVRRNQLPTVLAGLAPIRPIVDVGSGVRDLIAVPIREYKKDGRIVRSIQKGAVAFAKTTATELVNLGAKLAIGTQQVLQSAEGMLVASEQDEDIGQEATKQISLYADQPVGIVQGLRGAYASLERDLLLARDAIVAVPGEVMASGSATGAAKAVLKQSPTIILRPAIGATKAVGQTLLGAGNTLDRRNLRRIEEKYKRH